MNSGYLVAALIGVGIGLQVAIVGKTASSINPLTVSLALQVSGVVVAGLWAWRNDQWGDVVRVAGTWWWIPLGVGGWAIVAALGYSANRIGIASTLAVSIGAQLATGLVVDSLRDGTLNTRAALGATLVVIGAIVVGA